MMLLSLFLMGRLLESFTFYVDVFFPLSLPRLLPDLTVYMSKCVTNIAGVL